MAILNETGQIPEVDTDQHSLNLVFYQFLVHIIVLLLPHRHILFHYLTLFLICKDVTRDQQYLPSPVTLACGIPLIY